MHTKTYVHIFPCGLNILGLFFTDYLPTLVAEKSFQYWFCTWLWNEKLGISIQLSLKRVPLDVSVTKLVYLRVMARHWTVDNMNPLRWRDGVSNHRRLDCFLNRLFRRRSKKTSKLSVTGLYEASSPVTGGFPHTGPVTRKIFPFHDIIKICSMASYNATRPQQFDKRPVLGDIFATKGKHSFNEWDDILFYQIITMMS